jgi:dihydroflavonol-4-reductase
MDLVTGGTGFVGAHIVRALLARGRSVRCLVRPGRPRENLRDLPVDFAAGDLADLAALSRALAGVSTLYHCAADYRLYAKDPPEIYATNVAGTENILRAAAEAGVARVVYTSSVGALGRNPDGAPANEDTSVSRGQMTGHYKKSKYDAERVAFSWASRGLGVVIVNPSTPVGELDIKPTPTGQMIVDFLNRRMPAYVDTGLNVIDVRDVGQGHILAAERGRVGEKYILGNRNMTLKEILDTLSDLTAIPAPRVKLPHWIPLAAAACDSGLARLTGRVPRVPLEGVRMSRYRMFFDASKALRELALPQTPVKEALARAVAWFRKNGYAHT